MMDSEPGLDDLAKTILDAEPLAPIPSESLKVEGGPYEIEDPTPKDPPGMEPPMYHPGPQAAPPFPSAMEADPLAPPAAATLPPPSPVGATLEAPPSLAPVGGSEPPPLETREDSALQEALTEAEPSSKQKPTAQEQMGGLPPMPSEGPPGFLAGFGYFFKVTGARWKRGSVITAFKWEIYANEKELKKVQEELGRHAWTSRLDNPLVSEQMGNLNGLETQRAAAQQERQSMAQLIAQEEEGFAQVETRLQGAIQGAQEEVDSFKSELSEKSAELKNLKQRLSQEQKELSRLASQRKTKEGQAGKAKDPEQQANLSQEAAQIGLDIQKAEERETATEAHVAELLGPVDELTAQLTAARANKTGLDKEMSEAKAALSKKTQGFRAEEKKQATEEERLDGEITEALTQMGQTLDEQRPAGAGLDSYYGQLNGIREEIQERERSIQLLEAERENYNRKGYKNGVILMASIGGFLLAVTLTLVLLFTFVFNN